MQLKLRLGDILQDNPKSKYYLSDKGIENLNKNQEFNKFNPLNTESELAACITARCNKASNDNNFIEVDNKYYLSDKLIESFTKHKERHTEKGTGFKWQVKKKDDVANCLRANASLCPTDNTIEVNNKVINPLKDKTNYGWHFEQNIYDKNGITRSLKASEGSGNKPKIINNKSIRRLTPLECWRLQGFKDEDFFSVKDVSDTQLYKQAGNSITVDVLMELFKKIYANHNK